MSPKISKCAQYRGFSAIFRSERTPVYAAEAKIWRVRPYITLSLACQIWPWWPRRWVAGYPAGFTATRLCWRILVSLCQSHVVYFKWKRYQKTR